MPNPWDAGSARILADLGFPALATTSSGFAATLGRFDMSVTRDEAIGHAAAIAAAVDVPVSADLENCFADDPAGVAETVRLAREAGFGGCLGGDTTRRPAEAGSAAALCGEAVGAAVGGAGGRLAYTPPAPKHPHAVT